MEKIIWTSAFSVGHPKLDRQHHKIISLINRMIESRHSDEPTEVVHEVLNEMLEYSMQHLEYEELLLREIDFPDLPEHRAEHLAYIEKTADWSIAAMSHNSKVPERVLSFLHEWWVHHILHEDMKYRPYMLDTHPD